MNTLNSLSKKSGAKQAWRDAAASASALVRQRGQRSPSLLKESTTEDPLRAGTLSDMPNRFRELIQNLSVWSTQ